MDHHSEALAVHDLRAGLLVLLLGDPAGLEGRQRREDGPADPHRVLALLRGHHLHLHGRGHHLHQFLAQPLRQSGVHGGASAQHDVLVEAPPDVHVRQHDRVVDQLREALHLLARQHRVEQRFRCSVFLAADADQLAVGQLIMRVLLRGVLIYQIIRRVRFSSAAGSQATQQSSSLIFRPISSSLEEVRLRPTSLSSLMRQSVRSRPAKLLRSTAWLMLYPSKIGTVWVTPSPASSTIPVVLPEPYIDSTAWMERQKAGTLKVSNMISVIFSLFSLGLRGASVSSAGWSSGLTLSSLQKQWCQMLHISSQFLTMPCFSGYYSFRMPFLASASSPMYTSFVFTPAIDWMYLGQPTMAGKEVVGASWPEKPALHIPEPLSMTTGVPFQADIKDNYNRNYGAQFIRQNTKGLWMIHFGENYSAFDFEVKEVRGKRRFVCQNLLLDCILQH